MADDKDGYFFTRGGKVIFVPYKKSSDGAGGTHEPTEKEKERLKAHGISVEEKEKTPAEKIASVHIDFDRDNILPELNEEDLEKIGAKKNKPILLKKYVIDRNAGRHGEVSLEDVDFLVGQALYSEGRLVSRGKYPEKPYFVFYKNLRASKKNGKPIYGTVLVEVTEENEHFEVVHFHWVREKNMKGVVPDFKK